MTGRHAYPWTFGQAARDAFTASGITLIPNSPRHLSDRERAVSDGGAITASGAAHSLIRPAPLALTPEEALAVSFRPVRSFATVEAR